MADRERTIAVKVSVKKEGDDVLQDMAKDADALGKRMETAGSVADRVLAQVEKGGKVSKTAMLELASSVEKYEASMKAAEAVGKTLGDAEVQGLEKARHAYEAGVEAIGKYQANVQKLNRATEDAAERAGASVKNINSLDDIIGKLAEDLGPAAVKWISWGTAAAGAFEAGYKAGEAFRKTVNDMTGGELDRLIQKYNPIIAVVNEWGGAVDKAGEAARTANEKHILLAHGIDTAGNSAAQVHAKFAAYTGELQKHAIEVDKTETAYKKWADSLPAFGKALDAEGKALEGNVKQFEALHKEMSSNDIAKILGPQVDAMVKKLEEGGRAVPAELKKIDDAFKLLATISTEAAKQTAGAAGQVAQAARATMGPAMQYVSAAIDKATAAMTAQSNAYQVNAGLAAAAAETSRRVAIDMNATAIAAAKGADALAKVNAAYAATTASGAAAVAAAKQLATTLGELGNQADSAAQKIVRVFNGVAGPTSTGLPVETGEFGHGLIVTQTDPTVETGGDW